MECEQGEKNTSEENHVHLSEKSCEDDVSNSCLDSKLLKKNHSGFIEELDFEDEFSNGCDNITSSEFHQVPEETDSVKDEKILLEEEVEFDELSETEASKKDVSSDSKGEISENSSNANDDIEEGEVKDDSSSYDMKNTMCRYFLRGKCDWGNNCRFFHVTDKGLYNMFDNVPTRKTFIPPPVNIVPKEFNEPNFPQPREYIEVASSGWDRALNEAKQAILRSKARREEDDDFEDKKLYHTFRDDMSHFKKYSPPKKQFPSSNVNNLVSCKLRYKSIERSLSFKVLKNKSESPPNQRLSRKREVKYVKKSDYSEKWQDPWRRSKSPEKRRRWRSSSSSSSKKSPRSERSSVSMSSCASDTSCSCSVKSLSPESKTVYHRRVHNRNGSVPHSSHYRSVSRSVSRSRSRRTSWSSISSSSLSSVSSSTTIRSENMKNRNELRSRQHPKNEVKNKRRYSPLRSESRYSRSSSPPRYHSPAIKSPLRKRRRRNSSDMSISPDSRSSNQNRKHVELQKSVGMNEKSLSRISKRDPFSDNGLVSRMDHSDKLTSRGFASEVQLKRTVEPSKVQGRKPIHEENIPYSNIKREKSNVALEEKKSKDKDLNLPKRGSDLSGSHNITYSNVKREKSNLVLEDKKPRDKDLNLSKRGEDLSVSQNLSNKHNVSCKNSASEVKQKKAKDSKTDVSSVGNDLLKYHFLTKSMKLLNNSSSAKIEKQPTNPPNKPSVTSESVSKPESVKQQVTVNEPKRKITLNLHSKNDKQIKLSEDSLKIKSSKKSNLPPQTSRREQLLKQLKAVEEAIARKKTTVEH